MLTGFWLFVMDALETGSSGYFASLRIAGMLASVGTHAALMRHPGRLQHYP